MKQKAPHVRTRAIRENSRLSGQGTGLNAHRMVAETAGPFAGLDVPFAYNVVTNVFQPMAIPDGAASLPTTPVATVAKARARSEEARSAAVKRAFQRGQK